MCLTTKGIKQVFVKRAQIDRKHRAAAALTAPAAVRFAATLLSCAMQRAVHIDQAGVWLHAVPRQNARPNSRERSGLLRTGIVDKITHLVPCVVRPRPPK